MRRFTHLPLVALALLAAAFTARAEGPDVQVSGYGTLAGVYADTDQAQFRSTWEQSRGSRGRLDWGVDSRFGLQANASFNDVFSISGQVLAQRQGRREKVSAQWLYAQAEAGAHVVARAGRVVLPAFMQTDVRNVGYAQHWVRVPYEVYLTLPPVDGAQLLYRDTWRDIKFTVQPTVGRGESPLYYELGPLGLVSAPTQFHRIAGLHLTAEHGPWNARIGTLVTDATIGWRFRPAEEVKFRFSSVGLQYDDGRLLAMVERMNGRTDSGRYDITGSYATAGYRFGAWMPYATVAAIRNDGSVVAEQPDGRTRAVGLRWDAFQDVAVKLQGERSRLSGQQFITVAPAADRTRSVNVFTLAVDFVF